MPCERKHVEAMERIVDRDEQFIDAATTVALRAAISAALAACDELSSGAETGKETTCTCTEQQRWRSMESAPKDGTAVLLHNNIAPGNPSGRMESCEGHNTVVGEWWASDESDRDADGFGDWMCYMDAIEDPRCPFDPTHWMPLPAAPEGKP